MSEKNLLILQSDRELKDYELERLHEKILEQKELGVILLPTYVKVVKIPEGEIDGEVVVMNCGECKAKQWTIRDEAGCYFKSLGRFPGTATIWESNKDEALKYDTKLAAENMKLYLCAWYDCQNLKVEEI